MEIPKDLKDKIWNYCRLNDITDLNGFMIKNLKKGFDIEVYGLLGETLNDGEKDLKTSGESEKQLIKEVIVEKRVEVPVEIIKEVEKIVEVPVEKVVTKIEYISDETSKNELGGKIAKLEENIFQLNEELTLERKNFSTKTQEMENFFQKEMSKKDEELDELRRSLDISLDDSKIKMLEETLQKLRKDIQDKNQKIKDLEQINQDLQNTKNPVKGFFMRGSNINDTL